MTRGELARLARIALRRGSPSSARRKLSAAHSRISMALAPMGSPLLGGHPKPAIDRQLKTGHSR